MERKDYEEKIRDIKDEILDEIRWILEYGVKHNFKETFYVNYVKGEVFCTALEVNGQGMITFHVINDVGKKEKIDGEDVYTFDPNSFIDILDHLKKDIREDKLAILRDIVKKNGGRIDFDGSFSIDIDEREESRNVCGIAEGCCLMALGLNNGTLMVQNTFCEEEFINKEDSLLFEDLDKLIAYVKNQTYRKFVVRVSGTFSRTFDINASSYEEALALAKESWETTPLYFEDSNGENWEDYTSQAD